MKNKKDIKEKLNKLKKPLFIISVVFNVLFILFLILGLTITKSKTQSVSAENDTSYPLTTLYHTEWQLNNSISNSPSTDSVPTEYYEYYGDFRSAGNDWTSIRFGGTNIINAGISYGQGGNYTPVYNYGRGWVSEDFQNIYFYQDFETTEETQLFINWLPLNATLLNREIYVFNFVRNFNYNAPFCDLGSTYLQASYDQYGEGFRVDIYTPDFVSNGVIFNHIRLYYSNGNGTTYKTGGEYKDNNNLYSYYFVMMEYRNRNYPENDRMVFSRTLEQYTKSGNLSFYITNSGTWKNIAYQELVFNSVLEPDLRDKLAQYNNSTYIGGFTDGTSNIGLDNVFILLSSAFGSLTSIWSIQLIPGISIGLLLFMPLVVSLIIGLIWLVKR